MRTRLVQFLICALGVFALGLPTASAQSTRDEWLALRTTKQARHHRLPGPATRPGALTITTIRFYSDSSGNLVGVGEARNDSTVDLTYSRINFRFFDADGTDLGGEWTYIHGGVNARIPSNNRFETVLPPSRTGFFKVWTTIPAVAMSSYSAASAGEDLPVASPRALQYGQSGGRPEYWSPLVAAWRPPSLVGQRVSGLIHNGDPSDIGCLCGHPKIFAYAVRVSVAAFSDGVISDVQSTLAVGPHAAGNDRCGSGEPTTGIGFNDSARYTIDLARPADSIGRLSVEWQEMEVMLEFGPFSELAAQGSFTFNRPCGGWTATSTVPWISVIEGASSDQDTGRVIFRVERNFGTSFREGRISVSGGAVNVFQGGACPAPLSPTTVFLGAGLVDQSAVSVNAPSSCSYGASSDAAWLEVFPLPDRVIFRARANLTGATRSAVVRLGAQFITVHQSGGMRSVDVNDDGRLDLLWHHQIDGRVAAWRMNGVRMADGTLLTPGAVPDTSWIPVAAGDLDRDGATDILWQNTADGRLSFWRMAGTVMRDGAPLSPSRMSDTDWKIRALSDFNLDGDPDIIWQHETTGRVAVWFMRTGLFISGGTPTQVGGEALGPGIVTDFNWKIVGSGDFNGDVWPDLVWQHQGDGRIAVWQMRRTTLLRGDLISPGQVFDLDWKIRGVGDINGDDRPDLLWQHRVTGEVGVWLMNGTTLMSGLSLGVVPDTNWEIVAPR